MSEMLSGAIIAGNLVVALYFLKFWRESADRLFLIFAIAFAVLGVQRILLTVVAGNEQAHVLLYVLRLLAFVLILVAIIDKNRAKPPSG